MQYRKLGVMVAIPKLVGMGFFMTTLVQAAPSDAENTSVLQGLSDSSLSCLDVGKSEYPCASTLPFSYRSSDGYLGQSRGLGDPQEGRVAEIGRPVFFPFKSYNFWDASWGLDRHYSGMNLNLKMDHAGPRMKVDFGVLELNVTVDDGGSRMVEPQFFLGIKSPW